MPHYVTKLGEKFLLLIIPIFYLAQELLSIQKLFGALGRSANWNVKRLG
jgi:hypothetical protein